MRLVNSTNEALVAVFGPLHQYLVTPEDVSGAFPLMRAIVPTGIVIPLQSHADPEVFLVLEGTLDFLHYDSESFRWVTANPSDLVCIPGGVRHALRNSSSLPTTMLLATTPNIYDFFRELEKPFDPDQPAMPPTPEDMQRLLALAAKYKYWIASPQENAAVGLTGF
jgi:quercetin dioxygenase-like cupin family protein